MRIYSLSIPFLIDSGASVNVLARHHYEKLALQDIPNLQSTDIYPYGSKQPILPLGFVAFEGSLRSRRLVRAGKEETPAQMAMTNLFSPI
jgi:hypothetical protein